MKILVVEDEVRVRNGIVNKVKRLAEGWESVDEAGNGEEAFAMINRIKPDIVVTDIKMPGMSGLLLIEKAREINPYIKFIIISGYEDFNFAKKAIQLGVYDYLLKPVVNEELKQSLKSLSEKIRQEQEELRTIEIYSQKISEDFLQHKNKIMEPFYYHRPVEQEDIRHVILRDGKEFDGKYYTAVRILVKLSPGNLFGTSLIQFIISNIAEECLGRQGVCIAYYRDNQETEVCIMLNHDYEGHRLLREVDKLRAELAKIISDELRIAIGSAYGNYEDYQKSLQETRTILAQYYLYPDKPILGTADYQAVKDNTYALSEETRRMIARNILFITNNYEELKRYVISILDEMAERTIPYLNFKTVYLDLVILMINEAKSKSAFKTEIFPELDVEAMFPAYIDLKDIKEECIKLIRFIYERAAEDERDGGRGIVQEIRKRIDEEYFHDLKLAALAEEYFINQSYLSTLFYQETGENFTRYLTDVRVHKAIEMLETTQFSTAQIAEFVGYNDRSYFTGVFQKKVGMSPAEYRKRNVSEKKS